MRSEYLKSVRRVVVKIGSAVLCDQENRVDRRVVAQIVKQLSELKRRGVEVVVVSSGAVAVGMEILGLDRPPSVVTQKQAIAALGQSHLISTYEEYFKKRGILVAQLLLTHDDLANRERYINARHALTALLDYHILPIINENDTVSVDEIKFGDNDRLSALCAAMIDADLLMILSDIDGLYTADPRQDPNAALLRWVPEVTDQVLASAGKSASEIGTGGMVTKVQAIKEVSQRGIPAVIAGGKIPGVITAVFAGKEHGTFFPPIADPLTSRKHWIAYTLKSRGRVLIDNGAVEALVDGKSSLLSVGITGVEGSFSVGDAITICDPAGNELARGLTSYSAREVGAIAGRKTTEIDGILGYCPANSVVHRDDLVLL